MPDPRDIAQRINALLQQGREASATDAPALASAYARLSRHAYERLVRCQELLARGLRSEAVQESETEPDLLMLTAALELEDASGWSDFCRRRDLDTPYVLSGGIVAELNRAYAADQLVGPLMREYRLRCTTRAPLKARIAALRALSGVDRGNRVWTEDLVMLEKARLEEITREIDAALGEVETLQEIQRELIDDRRKVTAPQKLCAHVERCLQDSRVSHAQRQLESMMPALGEAYSAMDFTACEASLATWTQTLKSVGRTALQVPEGLRDRVEPVMRWVEQQSARWEQEAQFQAACAQLAKAVREDGSQEVLEQALGEAASFEQALPAELERDAREELGRRVNAARRRRRLRAALAVAAVLAVCGTGALLTWQQLQRRHVDERLVAMDAAVQRVELASASAIWEELSVAYPGSLERLPAQQTKERLDRAVAHEEQRRGRFLQLHEKLENTADEQIDADLLRQLEALALADEEVAMAGGQRERWALQQEVLARQNETTSLERAAALKSQMTAIGSAELDEDPDAVVALASAVAEEVAALRRLAGVSSGALRVLDVVERQAKGLDGSAREVKQLRERERQISDALELIAEQGGSPELLEGSLLGFAERFPESPWSASFAQAAEAAPAWRAVGAWDRIWRAWETPAAAPATPKEAARRVREANRYLEAHPASPLREAVRAYRQHWGAGLLASAEDGPWLGELPVLLRAPIFRDLGMAVTRDGRRYYVVGDGDRRETSLGTTINVVLTPDTTRTTTLNFEPGVLGPVQVSPQSALVTTLLEKVADYELENWQAFSIEVVDAVRRAEGVDAVLRAEVIKLLVRNLEDATGSADPALIRLRDQLETHGDAALNWLDPENLSVQATWRFLEKILEKPFAVDAIRRRLEADQAALHAAVSPEIVGYGTLLPGKDGAAVVAAPSSAGAGKLNVWAVVMDGDEADRFRWKQIGETHEGGVRLDPAAVSGVAVGSPVWFVRLPEVAGGAAVGLARPSVSTQAGGG